MPRHRKKIIDIASAIVLLALIVLDITMWAEIFASVRTAAARIYFLPVSQGESALLVLPNSVMVLTDAGPDAGIVDDLQKIWPAGVAPYIDLAIISYPQADDYGGYEFLIQNYAIGAFLYNGRADVAYGNKWQELIGDIAAKHIPMITIGAGDRIRDGVGGEVDILSPDASFTRSADPSDTGIVQRVITPDFTALLAADIGMNVESVLLGRATGTDLHATILKAPFPGLGTAGGDAFLRAVAPRTIVVAPGIKGTASVPTKAMLAHLASSTTAAIITVKPGVFLLYNK